MRVQPWPSFSATLVIFLLLQFFDMFFLLMGKNILYFFGLFKGKGIIDKTTHYLPVHSGIL